jgi:hemolysin III
MNQPSSASRAIEWLPGRTLEPTTIRAAGLKPRLRGWLDVVAAAMAVPAVLLLLQNVQEGYAAAAAVYGASLLTLFAVSGCYHVPMWPVRVRAVMRKIDHATIYVLIAGSYTPVCVASLPAQTSQWLLPVAWTLALVGVAKTLLWPQAPRLVNTAGYVLFGWLAAPFVRDYFAVGVPFLTLLGIGGFLYSAGAVIYARRRPDPAPLIFGYHELFHALVVLAAACHYWAMWILLT